ncbi:MAG: DUF459 domain-containing protein [Hyphomicrobiales bacterium]|nr:MAG: DUF459 domain-containing protein [Hyphomicrobiales bacterium]
MRHAPLYIVVFALLFGAALPDTAALAAGPSAISAAKTRIVNPFAPLFRMFRSDRRRPNASAPQRSNRSLGGDVRIREPAAPKIEFLPKDPDAKIVLVIGDTLASGLVKGLQVAFADNPKVDIRGNVRGSSGLVRDDHHNWPQVARDMLANGERFDAVVILVGVNDRQSLRIGKERHALRSEPWEKAYRSRAQDLLTVFLGAGKPVVWVGLPPTSSGRFTADMAYFNDIFKATVDANGGTFVDIWKSFLDEEGRYTSRGPDVEGRRARLRAGDGIHFSGTGYRKLAFFVEMALKRVLAIDGGPAMVLDMLPDGRPAGPQIGVVLPLTGPIASADDKLAGEDDPWTADGENALYRLTVLGEAPQAVAGRVDDFGWPRKN